MMRKFKLVETELAKRGDARAQFEYFQELGKTKELVVGEERINLADFFSTEVGSIFRPMRADLAEVDSWNIHDEASLRSFVSSFPYHEIINRGKIDYQNEMKFTTLLQEVYFMPIFMHTDKMFKHIDGLKQPRVIKKSNFNVRLDRIKKRYPISEKSIISSYKSVGITMDEKTHEWIGFKEEPEELKEQLSKLDATLHVEEVKIMLEDMFYEIEGGYPLPERAITSAYMSVGISKDDKANTMTGFKLDYEELDRQLFELRNALLRESLIEYKNNALQVALSRAKRKYLDSDYPEMTDYTRYDAEVMRPLTLLVDYSTGKRLGATKVNAWLGPLRKLEIGAEKGGAAGVPSTLRGGRHNSKITSKDVDSETFNKRTGLKVLFTSAAGATGTVVAHAQINDRYSIKSIFKEPRNEIDGILDTIRGNETVLSGFLTYIDAQEESILSESEKDVLFDMILGSSDDEYGKYSGMNMPWGGFNQQLWFSRRHARKIGKKIDVRTKSFENAKAANIIDAFNGFLKEIELSTSANPLWEALRLWKKELNNGAYREVMQAVMQREIATYQKYLAITLQIFRRMAQSNRSSTKLPMSEIEAKFELNREKFEAEERINEAERMYLLAIAKIGQPGREVISQSLRQAGVAV